MARIILLVIAISLDALSFGFACGLNKSKIKWSYALCMAFISTILFAVPLYISHMVIEYLNNIVFYIVNGIVLCAMGVLYLILSFTKKPEQKSFSTKGLKSCITSVFPISLDAIFTAFLNGYSLRFVIFGIIFYFVVTFCFIFFANLIALRLSHKSKLNIDWLSGVIFIILGILKFLEI